MDDWIPGKILEVLKMNDTSHNSKACLWSKAAHRRWQQEREAIKLSWDWQESWQDSDFDFTYKQVNALFARLTESNYQPFWIIGRKMIERWKRMAEKEGIRS